MILPLPCYLRHFQIFNKTDSFSKNFLHVFRLEKAKKQIESLKSSLICLIDLLISFFSLLSWITAENRTKLKKLFIWSTKSGGPQHHKQTNCSWLFIKTVIMLVIFGLNVISALFLIAGIYSVFNNKAKNVWTSKNFL